MNATDRFEAFLFSHEPGVGWGSHHEAWEAWLDYEAKLVKTPPPPKEEVPRAKALTDPVTMMKALLNPKERLEDFMRAHDSDWGSFHEAWKAWLTYEIHLAKAPPPPKEEVPRVMQGAELAAFAIREMRMAFLGCAPNCSFEKLDQLKLEDLPPIAAEHLQQALASLDAAAAQMTLVHYYTMRGM